SAGAASSLRSRATMRARRRRRANAQSGASAATDDDAAARTSSRSCIAASAPGAAAAGSASGAARCAPGGANAPAHRIVRVTGGFYGKLPRPPIGLAAPPIPRRLPPMSLPYELFIGLRYTRASRRAGRRDGFLSFISALSIAGIALGVAALIIVLSVMNGFQKEVRDRMLAVLSHVEIFAGGSPMLDWRAVLEQAERNPRVVAGAPYVSGQAMLTHDGSVRGVLVRGIDPGIEPRVADFVRHVPQGRLDALQPGEFGVAIGRELASQLLLEPGSKITLVAPQGTATPAGLVPRLRQLTVVAVFASGHYEYDSSLLLMNLEDAAKLFRVQGVTGVRLKTTDMLAAPEIARELASTLRADVLVRDWSSENRNWFAAVQIEKRMMFIILTLIMAVAAFNLVSMLVMTVTDK